MLDRILDGIKLAGKIALVFAWAWMTLVGLMYL